MKHPYTVVWLAEGCTVQALPTPRGKRNALLLNRGLVTAVLRLSEEDYRELVAGGPLSRNEMEGDHDGKSTSARDNGRGSRARASSRSRVGVVSRNDTAAGGSA